MEDTTRATATPNPAIDPAIERPGETVPGLLKRLGDDVSQLVTQEIALARAEINHSVQLAKAGVGSIASGGAVLLGGYLCLLAAAILGLSQVMEAWLAALIVGVVVCIIGFIMVMAGKKKLQPTAFKPDRTTTSLRKDADMVRGKRV